MKRLFDLALALISFAVLAVPMAVVALLVWLTSKGPVLYWSVRIGQNNKSFMMPKFRSMKINTPQVAKHLLLSPKAHLTPFGKFIRKYSIDELPQVFSVLAGYMSFVGPRPALFTQTDLVALRTSANIHKLRPGITGWAQINGRDEISDADKVKLDEYYLKHQSLLLDLKIIFLTYPDVVTARNIRH